MLIIIFQMTGKTDLARLTDEQTELTSASDELKRELDQLMAKKKREHEEAEERAKREREELAERTKREREEAKRVREAAEAERAKMKERAAAAAAKLKSVRYSEPITSPIMPPPQNVGTSIVAENTYKQHKLCSCYYNRKFQLYRNLN